MTPLSQRIFSLFLIIHFLLPSLSFVEKDPSTRPFLRFCKKSLLGNHLKSCIIPLRSHTGTVFPSPLIFLVDCSWWVPLLRPCWRDLFETVSLDYRTSYFALQVFSWNVVVLSLPACGRLSIFLHRIVDSMTCFCRRWVFQISRTIWSLLLFWSSSNLTLVSIISWT